MNVARDIDLMAWAVTDVEDRVNSIERLQHYHEFLPRVGSTQNGHSTTLLPADWSSYSHIQCRHVCLRYLSRDQNALDHITLDIAAGERIGIIGRTGCGKCTLLSAIPRPTALTGGSIHIDGVDIRKVPLTRLRSVVNSLLQEPLLFYGTLHENLDPGNEYTDKALWQALNVCKVDAAFAPPNPEQPQRPSRSGLQTGVDGGGSNFYAGQK